MSRFALEALESRAIVPEGMTRDPMMCCLHDFERAQVVIGLMEAEHRPLIERRFPEFASRVKYWHVADIEFIPPPVALAMIDDHVHELTLGLQLQAAR